MTLQKAMKRRAGEMWNSFLQSVFGRIFGYGRVMVRGMGVGEVVLPPIAQPIRLKKAIEAARTAARKKGGSDIIGTIN